MSLPSSFLLLLALSTFFVLNGENIRVCADTMVTGMVFCDQCKDNQHNFLDYPLSGAKVEIRCATGESKLQTTNFFGCYTLRLERSLDLSGCKARVVYAPSPCGYRFGPVKELNLVFRLFGSALYVVDPLLSQPRSPRSFCPNNQNHLPNIIPFLGPPPRVLVLPPPLLLPPPRVLVLPPPLLLPPPPRVLPPPFLPPPPRVLPPPFLPPPPRVLPPPPRVIPLPPRVSPPPALRPLMQGYACSYDKWMMPEYECYWKVVSPNTTVALAFGPIAEAQYGPNMTLYNGLQGKGNLNSTLLREATTSLLNSYHIKGFFYSPHGIIGNMNSALLGPARQALMIAQKFRRANSGEGGSDKLSCYFTHCK